MMDPSKKGLTQTMAQAGDTGVESVIRPIFLCPPKAPLLFKAQLASRERPSIPVNPDKNIKISEIPKFEYSDFVTEVRTVEVLKNYVPPNQTIEDNDLKMFCLNVVNHLSNGKLEKGLKDLQAKIIEV